MNDDTISYHRANDNNVSVSVVSRSSSHPSCPQDSSLENDEPRDDGAVEQCTRDEDTCSEFVSRTCGCKKANGGPCSSLFSVDHYVTLRAQAALLTRDELDMVILGSIMSTILDINHSIKDGQHKDAKRRKVSSNFMHHGHYVYKVTFGFLYGIGINHRVLAIRKHYQENGMETCTHQNSKCLPPRTLSFDDITRIVKAYARSAVSFIEK